jgi:hypothetical protein
MQRLERRLTPRPRGGAADEANADAHCRRAMPLLGFRSIISSAGIAAIGEGDVRMAQHPSTPANWLAQPLNSSWSEALANLALAIVNR